MWIWHAFVVAGPLTVLGLAGTGIGWLIHRRRHLLEARQANTAISQSYQEMTWTRYDGALAAEEISPGQKHIVQPEWYHPDHPCFDEYRRPLGDRWEPIPGTWYEMAPFGASPVPADAPFPDDLGLIRDYCVGARSGLTRAALLQFLLVAADKNIFNASSPNPMIRKMERNAQVAILQNPHAFNKEIVPLMQAEAERDPRTSLQVARMCQSYGILLDNILSEILIKQAEQPKATRNETKPLGDLS